MFELKPVPGFEGFYAVTAHGRVRSLSRTVEVEGQQPRRLRAKWVKPLPHSAGYLYVNLYGPDGAKRMLVHRVVALAWIGPPPPDRPEVNHIDAKRRNNCVANLEWVSRGGNMAHAWRIGNRPVGTPAQRAQHARIGRSKRRLTDAQADRVRSERERGTTLQTLADEFGVSIETISRIGRGSTYRGETHV